jgi:hypothetical protein
VGWWRRRLAVEVAIHRWDIEHAGAGGPAPRPPDAAVAAAGVEEFVTDLLLWLTNRKPLDPLDMLGNRETLDRWRQLRRVSRRHQPAP